MKPIDMRCESLLQTASTRTPPTFQQISIATVGIVAVLCIYLLRIDGAVGLINDDAWYVLFAKSLAEGQGYRLVNSPVPSLIPAYPPGFPAILSPAFIAAPLFPDTVLAIKLISVAAMMGVGVLCYRYLSSTRGMARPLSLTIASAVVTTPAFVFLATSTAMSECVFTLAQLGVILLVDRSLADGAARRVPLIAGMLAAIAFLIRTAGVPIAAAGALFLLARRRWQQAALFIVATLVGVLPWLVYQRAHAPGDEERLANGGAHANVYGAHFWMRWAGQPASGTVTAWDLPARVRDGIIDVFGRDVGAIMAPTLYRGAAESGEEVIAVAGGIFPASMGRSTGTLVVSLVLSMVAACGFAVTVRSGITTAEVAVPLSLAMIVLWPHPAYRFFLPLTPFLYLYFARGLEALAGARVLRIVLLSIVGLNLFDHVQYIARSQTEVLDWSADHQEVDDLLGWMTANLTEAGHVATTNPALVHLRTGRLTVAIDDPLNNWARWKRLGIRYLVSLQPVELPPAVEPYTVLYRSERRKLWVIQL